MWSHPECLYSPLDTITDSSPTVNNYFIEDRMKGISNVKHLEQNSATAAVDMSDLDVSVASRGTVVKQHLMVLPDEEKEEKKKDKSSKDDDGLLEVVTLSENSALDENTMLLGPSLLYQDSLGMTVTSGVVSIKKDTTNLIGISIGGGAPLCPCLYIVQVFDNTPAAKEGTLQSGDELVGVNGQSVKGKTKVEVAKMIQACKEVVHIKYNKLHADPQQGKSLDIILKKVKHRLVENMSTTTADALGLSRAILCNDTLVEKLQELDGIENLYRGLVEHTKKVLKAFYGLLQVYKAFGDAFAAIGVREPQQRASEAFSQFGDYHRQMEKYGIMTLKAIKPILSDLGTYLNKAIPDTKLTIRKYADTKFEYLSYCLKVKEMDDEEYSYSALQEPLYRVETGNYEYRLILRCRQDARTRFAHLRSDVSVKMDLLVNKHVQDVVLQLTKLVKGLANFHSEALQLLRDNTLFPIEMDLSRTAFHYKSTSPVVQYEDDDDDDELLQTAEEAKEENTISTDSSLLQGIEELKIDTAVETNSEPTNNNLSDLNSSFLAELSSLTTTQDLQTDPPQPILSDSVADQLISDLLILPPNTSSNSAPSNDSTPTGTLIGID